MRRIARGIGAAAVLLVTLLLWPGRSAALADPPPTAFGIVVEPARSCERGCWRLVSLDYADGAERSEWHHAFSILHDEWGTQVPDVPWTIAWWRYGEETALSRPAPEWSGIPLSACFEPLEGEQGPYVAYAGESVLQSDLVWGLGLPHCQKVSYYMKWKWDPGSSLSARLWLPMVQYAP